MARSESIGSGRPTDGAAPDEDVDGDEYPFVLREQVRFNDCDPLGHANNALFSTYLEQARIAVLRDFDAFILARVEIDFRSPLAVGEEVLIRTRCTDVRSSSFVLKHRITSGPRLVAEAISVMVVYDYTRGASAPVSEEVRALLGVTADDIPGQSGNSGTVST